MSGVRGRGLLVPFVLALAGFAVLLGLGTWQLNRKAWKEALIDTMTDQLAARPIELPPPAKWSSFNPDNPDFTRVRLHADFIKARDALVYTSGSSIRDDAKGTGYFVFSPARLADGSVVVVNRGFTPEKSYPQASGPQDIIGYMRWPEAPSWFVAAHDTAGDVWTVRDPQAMAQVLGWGAVAPFYVEQETPVPPGGLPHPSALKPHLRNEHLQYAITWYGLAAVLAVMSILWAVKRRRGTA